MSDTKDAAAVQDNIIFVPFKLQREIFEVSKAGGKSDVLGAATSCEPWVIDTIVNFHKRKQAKAKFLGAEKDPA